MANIINHHGNVEEVSDTSFFTSTGASLRDRASRAAHGALSGLRRPATIACAYGLIGIVTFGHVAAMPGRICWDTWTDKRVECPSRMYVQAALPAAIAWPLYWSWELQQ